MAKHLEAPELNVRELKSELTYKGFNYKRVEQGPWGFIYAQYLGNRRISYEIFQRKVSNAHPKSADQRPLVRFPSDESFGRWAWSFQSLDRAQAKYAELKAAYFDTGS